MNCPLCNKEISEEEFHSHVFLEHDDFWMSEGYSYQEILKFP